jgi:hypothetical protein
LQFWSLAIEGTIMTDTFRAIADNWIVMIVSIFFTAWLLGTIVEETRKYACHRKDVELKRDLAERGMSAEEIERIVAAHSRPGKKVKARDADLAVK